MKLKEIGDAIGVTESQASAYRAGRQRPSRGRMQRLAEAFGGSAADWLALAGYEPAPGLTLYQAKLFNPAFRPHEYFANGVRLLGAIYGQDITASASDFPGPQESEEEVFARLVVIGQRALVLRDRRRGKACVGQRAA